MACKLSPFMLKNLALPDLVQRAINVATQSPIFLLRISAKLTLLLSRLVIFVK